MKIAQSALIMVLTFIIQGCAPYKQYRTDYNLCTAPDSDCQRSSLQQHGSIRSTESYFLGFVEFDDQGEFKDRAQMHAVIDYLNAAAYEDDILMVVFVHGWHHTAQPYDDNIVKFQQVLSGIAKAESQDADVARPKRKARKVAGIYAGWRGDSLALGPLNVITFWDRKNTALKVGHGDITELLSRLELIKRSKDSIARREAVERINRSVVHGYPVDEQSTIDPVCTQDGSFAKITSNTKLVIVGHSFGGLVVQSAIGQILEERGIRTKGGDSGCQTDVEGFGNLVVMINPAFEAQQYSTLYHISSERNWFPPQQLPVQLILTSKGDDATGIAFPLGRRLSTIFEKDGWRGENLYTVGHYAPYITHELYKGKSLPSNPSALSNWAVISNSSNKLSIAGLTLERTKNGNLNPYLNVSVSSDLIKDHNDIGEPEIIEFIKQMILLSTIPDEERKFINFYTEEPIVLPDENKQNQIAPPSSQKRLPQ